MIGSVSGACAGQGACSQSVHSNKHSVADTWRSLPIHHHLRQSPSRIPHVAPVPRADGRRRRGMHRTMSATILAGAADGAEIITDVHLRHLAQAALLAQSSCGLTQPHPNAACIVTDASGRSVGEASLWAQGTQAPEVAAVLQAGAAARGGTAYLNLETGDCHGDAAGVRALLQSGVARVVIGLRHPLPALRGAAVDALRSGGAAVAVLGEAACSAPAADAEATLDAVLQANAALLHRAVLGRPLGLLKYAMTLDGKIASSTGHSAWVSSPESRQRVFEARARSNAVIVGGQTVRRDNPRLTTRQDGGHQPVRIVMSRTLDLPADAALWDVTHAPTIVATQRGARREFQRTLRARGVEVLEFDFLAPDALAAYCHQRGFLSCLWECGGTLAAPALAGGAIHSVMAFIAPKIIGGTRAPTPVGDLGFVEMTQALPVEGVRWEQVGPDLMLTGSLPRSGGLRALATAAAAGTRPNAGVSRGDMAASPTHHANGSSKGRGSWNMEGQDHSWSQQGHGPSPRVEFYRAWDRHGALSNFSPHAVALPDGPMTAALVAQGAGNGSSGNGSKSGSAAGGTMRQWPSTEHYYQAQKFAGVDHPDAAVLVEAIAAATSPEAAAALGRGAERQRPELVRGDWAEGKVAAMHAALRAKFAAHDGPRAMLLATASPPPGAVLVEASPHDFFWGGGFDGSGTNMLGKLLMAVREELMTAQANNAASSDKLRAGVASR